MDPLTIRYFDDWYAIHQHQGSDTWDAMYFALWRVEVPVYE